jgi:AmmeMemoRadiSam system protein A
MTSEDDRRTLLAVARSAITAAFENRRDRAVPLPPGTKRPEGSGGVFVTLKNGGRLRGCIGMLRSDGRIDETVAEMARSAAFDDPRFPRLAEKELPVISIEISRLSAFFPIRPEKVEVGTHGLYLRLDGRSGLLLPQVPGEQGWDRQDFLSGLCRKSGLPDGSLNHPEAVLEAFTAEVFGEDGPQE